MNSGGASPSRAAAKATGKQGSWDWLLLLLLSAPAATPWPVKQQKRNNTIHSLLLRSISSCFGSASLSFFFRWQIRCEGEAAMLGRGGVSLLLKGPARSGKLVDDGVEGWAADRSGPVGAAVLGLLLEEEGGPIWDLWAPMCRAAIGRLWWRPVKVA